MTENVNGERFLDVGGVQVVYEIDDDDGAVSISYISLEEMVAAGLAPDMDEAWNVAFEAIGDAEYSLRHDK